MKLDAQHLDAAGAQLRAVIVLAPGCSWLATAMLSEPWRLANRDAGAELVTWQFVSASGQPVPASNAMLIPVAGSIDAADAGANLVVVIASKDVEAAMHPALLAWLSDLGDHPTPLLAGIDAGPEILAQAGVLDGHTAAMHHETMPFFRERYLGIELSYGPFTIDETRATCAGSATTLDFSLALLDRFVGSEVATRTAQTLIHTPHLSPPDPSEELAAQDDRVRRAMHALANDRIASGAVARAAAASDVSERHLHRLFLGELGMTPTEFSRRVRMRRALTLVSHTRLSFVAVAQECGFSGPSEFSRAFRKHHGRSPTAVRADARAAVDGQK